MAAVQAVTDPALARTLVEKLREPGGTLPRYYQIVLRVKSMGDMPVEISYMFHRELPARRDRNRATDVVGQAVSPVILMP